MYVIVDERDQLWGVLSSQELADKYIEENSSYPRRLRRIYVENLDDQVGAEPYMDADLEAELVKEGYTQAEIKEALADRSYPLEELSECLDYKAEQAAKELTSVDGEDLNEIGKDALSLIKKVQKAVLKY